jgi:hypothetical protein
MHKSLTSENSVATGAIHQDHIQSTHLSTLQGTHIQTSFAMPGSVNGNNFVEVLSVL